MCIESLPYHLRSVEAWKGTDHDTWWMRWFIPVKLRYLCFGPRDSHYWHRWREWPICVLLKCGKGPIRHENDIIDYAVPRSHLLWYKSYGDYVSRIQYWTRWHIQLQWPFFVAFHVYFRGKDVPEYPSHVTPEGKNTDNRLFYFYFGAHRDSDKIYWIPSVFLGLTWK
jgi:hypothetical protein